MLTVIKLVILLFMIIPTDTLISMFLFVSEQEPVSFPISQVKYFYYYFLISYCQWSLISLVVIKS